MSVDSSSKDRSLNELSSSLLLGGGVGHKENIVLPSLILVPQLAELMNQLKHDVHYVVSDDDISTLKPSRIVSEGNDETTERIIKLSELHAALLTQQNNASQNSMDFINISEEGVDADRQDMSLNNADFSASFIKVESSNTFDEHSNELSLDGFGEGPLLHENSKDVALSHIHQDSMLLDDVGLSSAKPGGVFDQETEAILAQIARNQQKSSSSANREGEDGIDLYVKRKAQSPRSSTPLEPKINSATEDNVSSTTEGDSPKVSIATSAFPDRLKVISVSQLSQGGSINLVSGDSLILGNFILVPDTSATPVKFQILHDDGTPLKEVSVSAICKVDSPNGVSTANAISEAVKKAATLVTANGGHVTVGCGEEGPSTTTTALSPSSVKLQSVQNVRLTTTSTGVASPQGAGSNSVVGIASSPLPVSNCNVRPFQCKLCSATFNRLGNYTRHQKIHTVRTKEDERFHCGECGKSFIQRCDLTRHLHVHNGTEPHRCSQCGKGYIRHSDLVTHQRFHNKEKPFTCEHCAKGFSQRGDLNRHLRSIHLQVRPLMCGHCQKKFAKEATLIRHMRTSHREMLLQTVLRTSGEGSNEAAAVITANGDAIVAPFSALPLLTGKPAGCQHIFAKQQAQHQQLNAVSSPAEPTVLLSTAAAFNNVAANAVMAAAAMTPASAPLTLSTTLIDAGNNPIAGAVMAAAKNATIQTD